MLALWFMRISDKGRRFAMWSLFYMLGSGPDL
jgi:hypothetical protein